MGVVVPQDLDLRQIANAAERRVVDALVSGLTDGWLVLPTVELRGNDRDREIDIVLVHPSFGVVVVEVKGHAEIAVREGVWCSGDRPMSPQPPNQAKENAYALRGVLRAGVAGLDRLRVAHAIALPNAARVSGHLGPDLHPAQVLTASDLDDVADAIEVVAALRVGTLLADHDVEAIVRLLRPDADFAWDPDARHRFARRRLDEICAAQVRSLETLDRNRRAFVLGAAGTGKTRLAERWVHRAYLDGRRVLSTCYNEPLAGAVAARLPDDPDVVVGPFLRIALAFEGMAPLPVPGPDDFEGWTVTVPAHLAAHWDAVTERFDTIVVDEAQDFDPRWIEGLARLLEPDGRLLVVADEGQLLYDRGLQVPRDGEGWAVCELVANCRNAHQIARLLRRHLGGGPAPAVAPEAVGLDLVVVEAGDLPALTAAVDDVLDELLDDEQRHPEQVAVLTCSSAVRDHLLGAGLGLARWEDRAGRVLCENVHRVKGLEADTVVLVADGDVADPVLYVGVSRAISELVVVAPRSVGARLGLV